MSFKWGEKQMIILSKVISYIVVVNVTYQTTTALDVIR